MVWKTEKVHRILLLVLAFLVLVYGSFAYPSVLNAVLIAATAVNMLVVAVVTVRRGEIFGSVWSPENVLLACISVVVVFQSFNSLPYYVLSSPPIERVSLYLPFVVLCHFTFVSFISIRKDPAGVKMLYGGILFSSILYLPIFQQPEGAVPFFAPLVLALAFLLLPVGRSGDASGNASGANNPGISLPLLALRALMVVGLGVSVLSYDSQTSLTWWFKFLALAVMVEACGRLVTDWKTWKTLLALALLSNLLPVVALGTLKVFEIAAMLGWPVTLANRLNLVEFGRSNLMVRELVVSAPVLVGFWWVAKSRRARIWIGAGLLLTLVVFGLSKSFGGMVAMGLAALVGVVLGAQNSRFTTGRWKKATLAAVLIVGVVGVLVFTRMAPLLNIGSFNGRLFQYRVALLQLLEHPFGVGPGVYHVKAQYADRVPWLVDNRLTIDTPFIPVKWYRKAAPLHFHNLLVEIGSGLGIPGIALLVAFLFLLFREAFRVFARTKGGERKLLGAVIIGLAGELGWDLLDVMQISPPFFSTAVWVYVGLVLSAALLVGEEGGAAAPARFSSVPRPPWWRWGLVAALTGWLLIVSIGNVFYRQGFTAFQSRNWRQAEKAFGAGLVLEAWNSKYLQLRGEARINQGRYAEALLDFKEATRLKPGFSPYENKIAWLLWLQGDMQQAGVYFEKAVAADPLEAWKSGLHTDLALYQAAAGQREAALANLQEGARLSVGQTSGVSWISPWRAVFIPGENFAVVLDPGYGGGGETSLQRRILAKLEQANYTQRLLDWVEPVPESLRIDGLLDSQEQAYRAALADEDRTAPALLATVAETARGVGLIERAEQAYREFQQAFPESAYGFRELGRLYLAQGRTEEALIELNKAAAASPRDSQSWLALAEAALEAQDAAVAKQSLAQVGGSGASMRQWYEIRSLVAAQNESRAAAAESIRQQLYVADSTAVRLQLASLYEQLVAPERAAEQCRAAADQLLAANAPLLDSQWWELAGCFGMGTESEEQAFLTNVCQKNARTADLLNGHLLRMKGKPEEAIVYYERAAQPIPADPGPLYFAGELYAALGQADLATERFQRAAAVGPEESLPLMALGRLQLSAGQIEAARQTFEQAARVTPGGYDVQLVLGNTLLLLGDQAAADQHYHLAQALMGWREDMVYSLLENMAQAEVFTPTPEMVRLETFTFNALERPVLFIHPDSEVKFHLKLPSEPVTFTFAPVLSPDSWTQEGDGVLFSARIEVNGLETEIYSRYVDPKHTSRDRAWHAERVDLSAFAGQEITLTLHTSSGPQGDNRFDWSGWGEPYLVR